MHPRLTGDRFRRRARRQAQTGYTLLEVMIATMLTGLLVAGLGGWAATSMTAMAQIRGLTLDQSAADRVNQALTSDAATALVIVSPTSSSPMQDCPGGPGVGGDTKLVMVTATKQRIVYSLAADSSVTSRGRTLFRRTCPNNPVVGSADFTQTDSLLTTPTTGTTAADGLAKGIASASAVCTMSDGSSADPDCRTVRLAIESASSRQPKVLVTASRRSDSYCKPGCKPLARFTFNPGIVQRNVLVSFDPTASRDLRGGQIVEWSWDFDRGGPSTNDVPCGAGIGGGASTETRTGSTPVTLTRTFTTVLATCPAYQVGLRVKNDADVWSDWYELDITPTLRRPTATITAPAQPINVVQDKPVSFSGILTSYEEPLVSATSTWNFGDNTAAVVACVTCGNSATSSVSHTFSAVGQYQVTLVATDGLGLKTTAFATVNVRSGRVFVRTGGSTNAATCGDIGTPCAKVADGITRAQNQGLTDVWIAGAGPYDGFTMASGVSVTGGFDNAFQVPASPIATTINKGAAGSEAIGVVANAITATTPTTKLKNVSVDVTGTDATATVGISVANSTGLVIDGVKVVKATGRNATGLRSTSSTLTITNSNIASGTPLGAGSSAYGLLAQVNSNIAVTNSVIVASGGVAGTAGTTPSGALTAGGNGSNGSGGNKNENGTPAGATGGGTGANSGGNGGNTNGGNGVAGANGGGGGGGGCNNCTSTKSYSGGGAGGGTAGSAGTAGTKGNAATAPTSSYGASGFVPIAATDGTIGSDGGGGGGGGGGGRSCQATLCAGDDSSGGSGAKGGGGGQGGAGGKAGGNAGGSFGVYSHNSTVTIDANTSVTSAPGGAGGAGAAGQDGASGGTGGTGGAGIRADCCSGGGGAGGSPGAPGVSGGSGGNGYSGTCCNGGSGGGGGGGGGGNGGKGGTGGGGVGGPSVGLLKAGTGSITFAGNQATQITIGAGGAAGAAPGGNAGTAGTAAKSATA